MAEAAEAAVKLEKERLKRRMDVVKRMGGVSADKQGDGDELGNAEEEEGDLTEEQIMQRMMGFGGFDSTKGKQIQENQKSAARGAVKKNEQRTYRQYMNRRGGFNRPLGSKSAGMLAALA
jgi:U4/U6.U5 tri-snRNP-associated protein 3